MSARQRAGWSEAQAEPGAGDLILSPRPPRARWASRHAMVLGGWRKTLTSPASLGARLLILRRAGRARGY